MEKEKLELIEKINETARNNVDIVVSKYGFSNIIECLLAGRPGSHHFKSLQAAAAMEFYDHTWNTAFALAEGIEKEKFEDIWPLEELLAELPPTE